MAKKGAMDILLPDVEVSLQCGLTGIMSPLPLERAPYLLESFGRILMLKAQGFTPTQLIAMAGYSASGLIRECLTAKGADGQEVKGADVKLYASDFPALFEVFIDQNVDDVIVGKWRALVERLETIFPEISELAAQIQSEMLPDKSNSSVQTDTEVGGTQTESENTVSPS